MGQFEMMLQCTKISSPALWLLNKKIDFCALCNEFKWYIWDSFVNIGLCKQRDWRESNITKSNRNYSAKLLNHFLLTVAHHAVGIMCRLVSVFYVFIRNSGSKCSWSLLQLPFPVMAFKGASRYSTQVIYIYIYSECFWKGKFLCCHPSNQNTLCLQSGGGWRRGERRGGDVWRTSGCHSLAWPLPSHPFPIPSPSSCL